MSQSVQIAGINAFLTIVSGQETRFGHLLAALHFDQKQIDTIRMHLLQGVLDAYISAVQEPVVTKQDGVRLYQILERRFGFDGKPTDTLKDLAQNFGVSRERVRQLEQKALRMCASKAIRQAIEVVFRDALAKLVGEPQERVESTTA